MNNRNNLYEQVMDEKYHKHAKNAPDYYTDQQGHDLFYMFRNGLMSAERYVGFLIGNIFKYVTRHGKKSKEDRIKDLKKARDYLDELIRFESGDHDEN